MTLVKAYLLRGQPFPALEPPAGQHVAAVLSGHARAEAVNLLALPLLGLISLEHLFAPLSVLRYLYHSSGILSRNAYGAQAITQTVSFRLYKKYAPSVKEKGRFFEYSGH